MSSYRYSERAARLWRAARSRIRPHQSVAAESAISVLAIAIVRGASRRRRRRITPLLGLVTAILGVALVITWSSWRSRAPILPGAGAAVAARPRLVAGAAPGALATLTTSRGQIQPLSPGHEWLPGERLRSDAFAFGLSAEDGTTISLQPRSDLTLLRADTQRWLRLAGGGVSVHVAKLRADERFVIVTPDAEVEVRGTRFHVAIARADENCDGGTATRVVVDEGVVVVRSAGRSSRVTAGARWPAECAEPPAAARFPSTGRSAGAPKRPSKVATSLHAPLRDEVSTPSTLATENDLFGAALKAERAGDRRAATQLLDVLISRFPASPLKESAEKARARFNDSTSTPP